MSIQRTQQEPFCCRLNHFTCHPIYNDTQNKLFPRNECPRPLAQVHGSATQGVSKSTRLNDTSSLCRAASAIRTTCVFKAIVAPARTLFAPRRERPLAWIPELRYNGPSARPRQPTMRAILLWQWSGCKMEPRVPRQ
jgi:hypothetical protein